MPEKPDPNKVFRDNVMLAAMGGPRGNINLYSRPRVLNPDGSISTVRSLGVNMDGREVLIPTVERTGQGILSDEDAEQQYLQTGEHLGQFATPGESTAYAQMLHEQFAKGAYDVPLVTSRQKVDPTLLYAALQRLLAGRR